MEASAVGDAAGALGRGPATAVAGGAPGPPPPLDEPDARDLSAADRGVRLCPMVRTINQTEYTTRSIAFTEAYPHSRRPEAVSSVAQIHQQHQQESTAASRFLAAFYKPSHRHGDADIPNVSALLSEHDILAIVHGAKSLFMAEETLMNVTAPARIVSDIHGQYSDLMRLLAWTGELDGTQPWVFLGDYVDRQVWGLEVVLLLMSLKIRWPEQVVLLRGNHEIRSTNGAYGFLSELQGKLGAGVGLGVWEAVNDAFDWLPLAAVVSSPDVRGARFLAVHGGIGRLETLEQIRDARRPITEGSSTPESERVLCECVWSDPAKSDSDLGFLQSGRDSAGTGRIILFGADVAERFCKRNNITAILRGHECIKEGLEVAFGGRVITFFSAVNYTGLHNNAGCVLQLAVVMSADGCRDIEIQPMRLEARQVPASYLLDALDPQQASAGSPLAAGAEADGMEQVPGELGQGGAEAAEGGVGRLLVEVAVFDDGGSFEIEVPAFSAEDDEMHDVHLGPPPEAVAEAGGDDRGPRVDQRWPAGPGAQQQLGSPAVVGALAAAHEKLLAATPPRRSRDVGVMGGCGSSAT